MKSFSELAALKARLGEEEARRRRALAEQARLRAKKQAEANVFRAAMAGVQPMSPPDRAHVASEPAAPIARQRDADERAALAQSMSDEIDIESLLDTDDRLSFRRAGIGPDVVRRLRRGEWAIRSQIDLHGLRVDEARAAFSEFLAAAVRADIRCVRVIHGKGLGSLNREPVLKGKVLKWLVQRNEVMAFCQARPNDGGAGALVVLLQVQSGSGSRSA